MTLENVKNVLQKKQMRSYGSHAACLPRQNKLKNFVITII